MQRAHPHSPGPFTSNVAATPKAPRISQVIDFAMVTVVLAMLWVMVAISPDWPAEVWTDVRGDPLMVRAIVALLLLPVVVATWAWQTDWPLALRVLPDVGIALATLVAVYPRPSESGLRLHLSGGEVES